MKRSGVKYRYYAWFVAAGLILLGILIFVAAIPRPQKHMDSTMAFERFTNRQYGFSIKYPRDLSPAMTFRQYYHLPAAWRIEASTEDKGAAILSVPVFRIDQGGVATGKAYPLYFDAEVRIGASSDPAEVKRCLDADPNYTGQPVSDVVINGIAFKKFHIQSAAMMQYLEAESFRTVHNNTCFAVEQIKTGSHYEDPSMLPGPSDAELNLYYEKAGGIIQSFQFLK